MLNFQGQQLTPFTEAAATQRSGFNALLSLVSGEAQRIEQNRAAAQERAQQLADNKAKQLHELNKIAYAQDLENQSAITLATDPRIREAKLEDYANNLQVKQDFADVELVRNESSRINRILQEASPNMDKFGMYRPPVFVTDFNPDTKTFEYSIPIFSTKTETVDGVTKQVQSIDYEKLSEQEIIGRFSRIESSLLLVPELQTLISQGLPTEDFSLSGTSTPYAGANKVKNLINRILTGDVAVVDEISRGVHNIPSLSQVETQSSQEERIQRNLATAVLMHEDISKLEGIGGWFNAKTFRRGTENRISKLPDGRTVVGVPVGELLTLLQDENFRDVEKPIAADLRERLIDIRANFAYYNDSDLNIGQAYINPLWRRGMPANRVLINKAELDRITRGQQSSAEQNTDADVINALSRTSSQVVTQILN